MRGSNIGPHVRNVWVLLAFSIIRNHCFNLKELSESISLIIFYAMRSQNSGKRLNLKLCHQITNVFSISEHPGAYLVIMHDQSSPATKGSPFMAWGVVWEQGQKRNSHFLFLAAEFFQTLDPHLVQSCISSCRERVEQLRVEKLVRWDLFSAVQPSRIVFFCICPSQNFEFRPKVRLPTSPPNKKCGSAWPQAPYFTENLYFCLPA